MKLLENSLLVLSDDDQFETINFVVYTNDDEENEIFYGPAETSDEAHEVLEIIKKSWN